MSVPTRTCESSVWRALRAAGSPRVAAFAVGAAAALFAAWLPAVAAAASVNGTEFRDYQFEGEVNTATVVQVGDTYQITDTTTTIFADAPCTLDGTGHVATCPIPSDGFWFYLGAQDDTFSSQVPAAVAPLVIWGEAGDDTLTGGAASESFEAGSGYDDVFGGDGNDWLGGGPDDDLLDGGAGSDQLNGGEGDDDLYGGPGADTADYSSDLDPVEVTLDDQANDGDESELDYVAADVENVQGGRSDDLLTGNEADNQLSGSDGADQIAGAGGADLISAGDDNDIVEGGPGGDSISGGDENDALNGGPGSDGLSGGNGDDQIAARDGEPDSVRCGTGSDGVVVDYNDNVNSDCELVDRSPAPPPPPTPPDTTAPGLALGGAATQRVLRQRGVSVVVTPAEACTVTAQGAVVVRGSAKVFKLTPAT